MQRNITSSLKKREIMPLVATQIDLEMIILSKANHTEKDKLSCDITYTWNLRKEIQMNFTKWKQTHRHRKQYYDYQRGKMG